MARSCRPTLLLVFFGSVQVRPLGCCGCFALGVVFASERTRLVCCFLQYPIAAVYPPPFPWHDMTRLLLVPDEREGKPSYCAPELLKRKVSYAV